MKKRNIFNLILILLVFFLIFVLYKSIEEPIVFKAEKDKRENAVVNKLIEIRKAQEAFRGVTGGYAPTFDSLRQVLRKDTFKIIRIEGDRDDVTFTGEILYDTTYIMAIDSINAMGIDLDALHVVPYANNVSFDMAADTLTYQKTLVNVVEVGVIRKAFMGAYGSRKYRKYDDRYDPGSRLKFGDLNKPTLAGNWEGN